MKKILLFIILLIGFIFRLNAQVYETAADYIGNISKLQNALSEKYLIYISAASHGKNTRKAEKRRGEVLAAITETKFNVMGMPPFKGDRSLKDTTVAYLKILSSVFNEDYGKIVNMEEIAEQSYDLMEAYMLAKEKAGEKLREANDRQELTLKNFASKNNVNLIESVSALDQKMKIVDAVSSHTNDVYLIFFKAYNQEAHLLEAVNQQSTSAIEQSLNSMGIFADEGLEKLKSLKGYNNDPSVIVACRDALLFYMEESKKGSFLTDYFLQQENFKKIKKQFESKGSGRSKQEVDEYNKAVKEVNAGGNEFNAKNAEFDKKRNQVIDNWNNANDKYSDRYIPTQRK